MAAGIGDLTLTFHYDSKAKRGAVNETLKIPFVTDIERSVNVNLTEMPTLIYGCRNNFCMDLGATEKVTFKCERINPVPYNDASRNPEDWSNGKWYRHLEDLFDRWQNFGYNGSGDRTGGCQIVFTPADTVLLPAIGANVFLTGAISPSYDVQKMSFSLPFTLGDMTMSSGEAERVTITLYSDSDDKGRVSESVSVLKGYPQTIPIPEGWSDLRSGMTLLGWAIGSESSTTRITANTPYTFSGGTSVYAIWRGAVAYEYIWDEGYTDKEVVGTFTVPSGATTARVTLVGGGGGGGGSGYYRTTLVADAHWYVGGGGGSGDVTTSEYSVTPGERFRVVCGAGGSAGTNRMSATSTRLNPTSGGDGGETALYRNCNADFSGGSKVQTASGGQGGRAATLDLGGSGTHGAGGSTYAKGGSHAESGTALSPNTADHAGQGGKDSTESVMTWTIYHAGGGGGGAAAFCTHFTMSNGTRVPSSGNLFSRGGDGGDPTNEGNPDPWGGVWGGGGGSGESSDYKAGAGGTGMALILFFAGGL